MEGGSESSKNEMMCWRSSVGRSVRKAIAPISSLDIKNGFVLLPRRGTG